MSEMVSAHATFTTKRNEQHQPVKSPAFINLDERQNSLIRARS